MDGESSEWTSTGKIRSYIVHTQESESPQPTPKKFDRHRILTENYRALLQDDINFELYKSLCADNIEWDDECYAYIGRTWLGTVFALTPSGKYYMPWTTNQTRADVIRDEAWWDALNALLDEHGMYADGDGGDIYLCAAFGNDSFSQGYLEGVVFTEQLESVDEIPTEFVAQALKDCIAFTDDCPLLLAQACNTKNYSMNTAGTDFWLSRNRHGAGFFDRGREGFWNDLQKEARLRGSVDYPTEGE